MKKLTLADAGMLLARLSVAMVMFYHGGQKIFGWYGGQGFEQVLSRWGDKHQFPAWLAWLGMSAEFFGSLGLAFGLFTRVAAFGVASTMGVAVWTHVKGGDPWNKVEFPLALGLAALSILLMGAGKLSLDQAFFGKRKK